MILLATDRLVDHGVKGLAHGVDDLDTLPVEGCVHLVVNGLDPLDELHDGRVV